MKMLLWVITTRNTLTKLYNREQFLVVHKACKKHNRLMLFPR